MEEIIAEFEAADDEKRSEMEGRLHVAMMARYPTERTRTVMIRGFRQSNRPPQPPEPWFGPDLPSERAQFYLRPLAERKLNGVVPILRPLAIHKTAIARLTC